MKTKQEKRREALARRQANLAQYEADTIPQGVRRGEEEENDAYFFARKKRAARTDIANLQAKLS